MACEFCGSPKLCSGGVCGTAEEAEGCANNLRAHARAAGVLTVALARADQADAAWRRGNLPMDRTRSRRMMLHPSPPRRFGLPSERVYFAHPMPDYDTYLEREAVEAIERAFGPEFEVVNPNSQQHRDGYAARGDFSYWTDLASGCGTVVFMALPFGWLGSGVWKEAESALRAGRRVQEVERGAPFTLSAPLRHLDVSRCLPIEETRRVTHMILAYREIYGG